MSLKETGRQLVCQSVEVKIPFKKFQLLFWVGLIVLVLPNQYFPIII